MNAKGNGNGTTPLDMADDKETANLLRKHGGKTGEELKAAEPVAKTPDIQLHEAAYYGNIEAVKKHLAAGTDVNLKDVFGNSPLHDAVANGQKEIVELLIAAGADVNAQRDDGETPLDRAIQRKQTELAGLLRKHGDKTSGELKAAGN